MPDPSDADLEVLTRGPSDSSRLLALKRLADSGRPDLARILQPIAQKDRSLTVRYLAQRVLRALAGAPAGFGDLDGDVAPAPKPRAITSPRLAPPPTDPAPPAVGTPPPGRPARGDPNVLDASAAITLDDEPTSPVDARAPARAPASGVQGEALRRHPGSPATERPAGPPETSVEPASPEHAEWARLERAALAVLRPCIRQMIELLDTADAELGAECAHALGRLRVADAFDRVAALVRGATPDDRLAKALGDIGDPRAAALLARLWSDTRWAKLKPAIGVAACRLRTAPAEEFLRQALADEDLATQGAIIRQLGQAGDARFVDTLLAKLGASQEWIEVLAIQALAPFAKRDARIVKALLERLPREANPRTASCIISALAEAGDPELVEAIERLTRHKDRRVRANAVDAVWRLAVPAAEKKRVLSPLLADEDNRVRANAARLMVLLGDARALDVLKAMLAHQDRWWRASACHALGACRPPGTALLLARALRDPELDVRLNATKALRELEEPTVPQLLLSLLADKNLYIRMHALEALGNLGVRTAASTVRKVLREEVNAQVLAAALTAVARTSAPDVTAREVAPFVTHSAAAVRSAAVEALEPGLTAETLPALMPALKDPDRKVRGSAVRALMRAGQVKVISSLYETLLGEDRREQSAVAHALGELADVVFDLRGQALAERLVEALRKLPVYAT